MLLGALCSGPWSVRRGGGDDMMKMLKDRWGGASGLAVPMWVWLKWLFPALLVLLLIVGALVYLWEDIRHWAGENSSNDEILRNLALAVGACLAAFIGLPLAIWRSCVAHSQAETANRQAEIANRQAETSERGLRNARYQKGAEMLGSDTLATRQGGVYALEWLAREHPEDYHVQIMDLLCAFVRHPTRTEAKDYHVQIMDLLCAFVRHPTRTEAKSDAGDTLRRAIVQRRRRSPTKTEAESDAGAAGAPKKKCPPDVEAAAKAVGNCQGFLSGKGRLMRIEDDRRPDLTGAKLTEAHLEYAHLEGVDLRDADLEGAHLRGAKLARADLRDARLEGVDLFVAHLEGAKLFGANLTRAKLFHANLTDAHLEGANLTRANLNNANLRGAYLNGANLNGADLAGTDLEGAIGLKQEMLDSARPSPPPKSRPEGLSWPFERGDDDWWRRKL